MGKRIDSVLKSIPLKPIIQRKAAFLSRLNPKVKNTEIVNLLKREFDLEHLKCFQLKRNFFRLLLLSYGWRLMIMTLTKCYMQTFGLQAAYWLLLGVFFKKGLPCVLTPHQRKNLLRRKDFFQTASRTKFRKHLALNFVLCSPVSTALMDEPCY